MNTKNLSEISPTVWHEMKDTLRLELLLFPLLWRISFLTVTVLAIYVATLDFLPQKAHGYQ